MDKTRVMICDDDPVIHDTIKDMLSQFSNSIELISVFDGEELLQYDEMYSILLLDIDMGVLDGIETAKRLKSKGIEPMIIMVSSKRERFKEAFMIGACRFVTKPIEEEELIEAIQYAKSQIIGYASQIVSKKGRKFKIYEKDIEYIKAAKDYVSIYCEDGIYEDGCVLKKFMEKIDKDLFVFCHRSYAFNVSKVEDVKEDCVIMKSGVSIPFSRRRKKDVLSAIMNYELRGKI